MSRPLPSLSSALLARKGGATPAMRRPVFGSGPASNPLEDLGWNDMGAAEPVDPRPVAPVEPGKAAAASPESSAAPIPPVIAERTLLAERIARQAASRSGKAAFTLRLDAERHLKLRLASAVCNRSAQQIVTEALDDFLAAMPEVSLLAERLAQVDGRNGNQGTK